MIAGLTAQRGRWLWLPAGGLAFLLALYPLSATLANGVYLPADQDSFYHAHRVLDALAAPWRLQQFDPRIHAPEGSWVTWPWAYDMMLAGIGHLAVYGFGVKQPLAVLAYVAPLWTFVNAALLLGAARRLGLKPAWQALVMLCYACSPLTQNLHRVGMLDHHYVEYSFVLATLYFGLCWFGDISNRGAAAALGVVLGMAPAFHNGLFIVQVPVLASLGARWLRDHPKAPAAAASFAAALLLSTLLFLLPSEPFRRGMFAFELQSWFHLFVAANTALAACLLARLPRSPRSAALLLGLGLLSLTAIYSQLLHAGSFLRGRMVDLADMEEVEGVLSYVAARDFRFLNSNYSGLLWLAPASLALLCLRLRTRRDDASLFFTLCALSGFGLLLNQYRFENYGSFTLTLPLCLLAQEVAERRPRRSNIIFAGVALTACAAYAQVPGQLRRPIPLGGGPDYQMTHGIYPALAQACAERPGIVLADNSDGHYITYHTGCAVIADNFIMTPLHERKLLEAERLMGGSLREALHQAPWLRYIYVRRNDSVFDSDCAVRACAENRGLRQELLFRAGAPPQGLRLVGGVDISKGGSSEPLARIFEVLPDATPR